MWPLVGWFTDYFCLNSLIPTFVLFVSAIASPMGIISFVLKATTMQWECCVFHTRGIPFFLFSCFWFCTPFFFFWKTSSSFWRHFQHCIFIREDWVLKCLKWLKHHARHRGNSNIKIFLRLWYKIYISTEEETWSFLLKWSHFSIKETQSVLDSGFFRAPSITIPMCCSQTGSVTTSFY